MHDIWLKPILISVAEAANDPVSATYFPLPLNGREDNPSNAHWLITVGAEYRIWTDKPEQLLVRILKELAKPPERKLRNDWD